MPGEEQQLRWAIIDQPAEDTPRIASADWLQEHGRDLQAQFVREQVAQAQTGQTVATPEIHDLWHNRGVQDVYFDAMPVPVGTFWTGLPNGQPHWRAPRYGAPERPHFTVTRGFVSAIAGRYQDLRPVFDRIFGEHPVTEVDISGFLYFDYGPVHFGFVSQEMYQSRPSQYPVGLDDYLIPDDLWAFGAAVHGWAAVRDSQTMELWKVLNATVLAFGQEQGRRLREKLE